MKLPALWIFLAFASGVLASRAVPGPTIFWLAASLCAVLAGICVVLFSKQMSIAAALALAAWFSLGNLGAQLEGRDVPSNDVARLIAERQLDISEPLRWFGRLRDDPEVTPLGWRYLLDLQGVEKLGRVLPVTGGLRLTYYRNREGELPPQLRAGDAVEALCRPHIPRNYLDPGAFDERGYLLRQHIDLLGSLRSADLLRITSTSPVSLAEHLARVRGALLARIGQLYQTEPQRIAVLRAMLLGDRNFVNSDLAEAFQKTAAFHVLVLAGLHVAALAVFFLWFARILRLPLCVATALTIFALAAYVEVVEQRPPIFRAALMTAIFLCARLFFRKVALVNTVSLAGLILLVARPSELFDSSYQLSFLAAGVIAGLAIPWIDRSSAPYRRAIEHLGDVTRDRIHAPRATQFRLDARAVANALAKQLPARFALHARYFVCAPIRVGLRVWDLFILSLCIQLGMLPLLAADFHRVSLSGPAANVFAVPLTGIIVPLGFAMLAVSYLSRALGAFLAKIEGLLVSALLETIRWFSNLPRASWRIPGPPAWLLIAFLAALIFLAAAAWLQAQKHRASPSHFPTPKVSRIEQIGVLAIVPLAVLVAIHPFPPSLPAGKLEATVLDVGQGDSIFVAFPDRQTMLIDGGGAAGAFHIAGYHTGFDVGEEVVSPFLWSLGIQRLSVVLLTHAHHDHIDGLRAVLNNFHVGQLWVGRDENSRAYRDLLAEARAHHVKIVHQLQGDRFNWQGTYGEILWPPSDDEAPAPANNDSVVLRIGFGAVHFLLPGDAEREVEYALLREHEPLQSQFLKVPHHGSKTSSTEQFLKKVNPHVAVISVGAHNPYGQPNPATVQRYLKLGVQLFETERNGAVTMLTDGRTVSVHPLVEN